MQEQYIIIIFLAKGTFKLRFAFNLRDSQLSVNPLFWKVFTTHLDACFFISKVKMNKTLQQVQVPYIFTISLMFGIYALLPLKLFSG